MNREEWIKAQTDPEALLSNVDGYYYPEINRAIELIRAAAVTEERELCAKIAEFYDFKNGSDGSALAADIAKEIREESKPDA